MLTRTRSTILATLALALGLTLAACGGGIGQDDVDAVRSQLEVVEQRLDDVERMLANATTDIDGSAAEVVDEAQRELGDTRLLLADVLAELAPPPPPPADPMPPAPDAPAF